MIYVVCISQLTCNRCSVHIYVYITTTERSDSIEMSLLVNKQVIDMEAHEISALANIYQCLGSLIKAQTLPRPVW